MTATIAAATLAATAAPAPAATTHTVVAGESLSSVAAANGVSPAFLADRNGLASDAQLLAGTELQVPTATTAAAAQPGAGTMPPWVAPIHHPSETPYLAQEAVTAWEAMRQESLREFGVDLYPQGSLSGYRTWAQQAHLYRLWQEGSGNPAAPPGSSSHEYGTAVDLATPEMRSVIDQIGARFGWQKVEAPDEWWHVSYVGL